MKTQELRQKNTKELIDLLKETRYKLGKLKFDLAAKKIKNTQEIKTLRREIAQILTIIKENERK